MPRRRANGSRKIIPAKGIESVQFEKTEHYRVTRDLVLRREKMLQILLSDGE